MVSIPGVAYRWGMGGVCPLMPGRLNIVVLLVIENKIKILKYKNQ
jgi:hypothetical protein